MFSSVVPPQRFWNIWNSSNLTFCSSGLDIEIFWYIQQQYTGVCRVSVHSLNVFFWLSLQIDIICVYKWFRCCTTVIHFQMKKTLSVVCVFVWIACNFKIFNSQLAWELIKQKIYTTSAITRKRETEDGSMQCGSLFISRNESVTDHRKKKRSV